MTQQTSIRTRSDSNGGRIVERIDTEGRLEHQWIYAPGGALDNETEWFDGSSGRMMTTTYYTSGGDVLQVETEPA